MNMILILKTTDSVVEIPNIFFSNLGREKYSNEEASRTWIFIEFLMFVESGKGNRHTNTETPPDIEIFIVQYMFSPPGTW